MNQILSPLSETLPRAQTVEQLTHPPLALPGKATGMESTYRRPSIPSEACSASSSPATPVR